MRFRLLNSPYCYFYCYFCLMIHSWPSLLTGQEDQNYMTLLFVMYYRN